MQNKEDELEIIRNGIIRALAEGDKDITDIVVEIKGSELEFNFGHNQDKGWNLRLLAKLSKTYFVRFFKKNK